MPNALQFQETNLIYYGGYPGSSPLTADTQRLAGDTFFET